MTVRGCRRLFVDSTDSGVPYVVAEGVLSAEDIAAYRARWDGATFTAPQEAS